MPEWACTNYGGGLGCSSGYYYTYYTTTITITYSGIGSDNVNITNNENRVYQRDTNGFGNWVTYSTGTAPGYVDTKLRTIIQNIPGYTKKWNTASNGTGTTYTSGQTIRLTASITLYSISTINTYTVTWNYAGGSGTPPSTTVTYNTILSLPTTPTKTGFTFDSWNTLANYTGTKYTENFTYNYDSNITLYANWTYTIKYYDNTTEITGLTPTTITSNISCTLPTPTKTGYIFNAWYTDLALNNPALASPFIWTYTTSPTSFYAKWTYTIKYYDNTTEITGLTPTTINSNISCTLPTPTKTGYTFNAWYTDLDLNNPAPASPFIWTYTTSPKSFYAKYTINTYTVTWDYVEGSGTPPSTTVTYLTTLPIPSTPARPGYTFNSWNTLSNYTGTKYTINFTYNYDSNITLYAKWDPNAYTITYYDNTKVITGLTPTTVNYYSQYIQPSMPSKTGYTSTIYWYFNSDLTGTVRLTGNGYTYTYTNHISLYAKYIANTNTVTWNYVGGSGTLTSSTVTYDATITLPTPAPTKTNYTFNGWYTDSTYTSAIPSTWTSLVDTTFYAKWTLNSFNLTFNTNSIGGANKTTNNILGTSIISPTPKAVGYTFNGWYNATSGGTLIVNAGASYTMPASDTTLYAQWTLKTGVKFSDLRDTFSISTTPISIRNSQTYISKTPGTITKLSDFKGKGPNI